MLDTIADKFLGQDFLLQSEPARYLYYEHASGLPIIDYHNHLPPDEIANDKIFQNITEIWLKGDHYKWRAMRANGIPEKYISGEGSDEEKFSKWAYTVPYTMRNPLFHWTHLELQRYFGIDTLLSEKTAVAVYQACNEKLNTAQFSTQNLLRSMKVEVLCTTDDPTDGLENHRALKGSGFEIGMLPTFRPDKFLMVASEQFLKKIQELEEKVGFTIKDLNSFLDALQLRVDFFHDVGCRLSDHGLEQLYAVDFTEKDLDQILKKAIDKKELSKNEAEVFQSGIIHALGQMYHAKGWTMQLHLGALRNNNNRLLRQLGADAGVDSIGDFVQAPALSRFMNRLDETDQLPKTILYNLNPADNEVFATMAGNFNSGLKPGKVQWGSAWWFLDQKDGMEKQINTLSNMGLLSRFIGMLTDSRSFLSFPRHEYFRRILCNLIGQDIADGNLPNDLPWLGKMVEDICYNNAKGFFDFNTNEEA
ncbi:MAG: glucuronate isomerase [Bacteroidota bacterium]